MTRSNLVQTTELIVEYETPAGLVRALDHPSFVVDGGTSVAIMGPSGCGKSTLLGLLAGLATPTRGTVTIGATAISDLPERERVTYRRGQLGMVYQADNLLPHLTVEENVALPLSISGRRPDLAPGELLARLGLDGFGARLPDQLSGGQRQRAAVARAIVHRPAVILADEPTGALDADNAIGVIKLLIECQRAIEATLIMVTHDPTIAAAADHIEYLERPQVSGGLGDVG